MSEPLEIIKGGQKVRICNTLGCANKAAKHRTICHNCKRKRYQANNPIKYAYQELRARAKKRGKEFTLTLEEFKAFCTRTEYMVKKGIYKESLHIDRIDETRGYTADNIQVLSNSENIKKYLAYCEHEKRLKTVTIIEQTFSVEPPEDMPF
jgi:hypothetical protein